MKSILKLFTAVFIIMVVTIPNNNKSLSNGLKMASTLKLEPIDSRFQTEKVIEYNICSDGVFKSYMDWKSITNTNSEQYQLQQSCWTDDNGIRRYKGAYVVAMGTYYAKKIGDRMFVEFEGGQVIEVIIGDFKDNKHVYSGCQHKIDGSVIEFIVDTTLLNKQSKINGSLDNLFKGKITKIYRVA